MKIMVVGGTRLLGSRLLKNLPQQQKAMERQTAPPSNFSTKARAVVVLLCCAMVFGALPLRDAAGQDSSAKQPMETIVFDRELPNLPGKSLRGVLVEYPPGAASPPHTHAKSAFIYATVLEGAIQSSVNGAPVKVYQVGENWYEEPGSHHGVSANASKTAPARLLAVFVVNSDEKVLTTPDK